MPKLGESAHVLLHTRKATGTEDDDADDDDDDE